MMSESQKKAAMRSQLNSEVEAFLAKGGKITKTDRVGNGLDYKNLKDVRKPFKDPQPFSPKAERENLLDAEARRQAEIQARKPSRLPSMGQSESLKRAKRKGLADDLNIDWDQLTRMGII